MNEQNHVIAAFDFDGTITKTDSLLPFFYFTHGKFKTLVKLILEIPVLFLFCIRRRNRQEVKERLLARFYGGWKLEALKQAGTKYAMSKLNKYIKPEALKRIHWHRTKGHTLILLSASLDIYLKPWGKSHGFNYVISSELEDKPIITGKLQGINCREVEKVKRLVAQIGPKDHYQLYAYGDSRGDKELLDYSDYPYYRSFAERAPYA